ncbi:hypothetical protein F5X96DRAFT_444481 [Biscogniauxia mediterranea]|nr:hypothetical protein F5X96DRAFT_444481 [Biscogniauxia mediterranea]
MRYFSGLAAASLACLAATAAGSPIAPRQCSSPPSSSTATATATATATSTAGACPPSGSARAAPLMYNLYPSEPDRSEAAVTVIEVEGTTSTTQEQAMVVGGIPAAAQNCSVIWIQAAADARDFAVTGSGLTSVLQLEGFPAPGEPVSWAAVAPFVESTSKPRNRHADFTGWDQPEYANRNHTLGAFDCAEEMRFHLAIDREEGGDGHVHFQQDEHNGFFVEYSC